MSVLNINVGILGHVDAGKTSLVRALSTELSTAALDKHPQSQERGITLDLGFSALTTDLPPHLAPELGAGAALAASAAPAGGDGATLPPAPGKLQFTLVDCPGHASLIKTIIGGAQIIDMVLLVVDVTKGIQTQTAECLVIAEITTDALVVVLNKVDMLPEEGRDAKLKAATTKIRGALAATRFADAPFIGVSATAPGTPCASPVSGLVDLMKATARRPARDARGPFFFSIDHCFAIKGQGTVMTGTVLSGSCAVNDSIELPELKQERKVKSMQMFRKPVARLVQGDRAGICVTNLDAALIERGIACTPGLVPFVHGVVALVKKIKFFRGAAGSGTKFHVTVGHATTMASVTFFGAEELAGLDAAALCAKFPRGSVSTSSSGGGASGGGAKAGGGGGEGAGVAGGGEGEAAAAPPAPVLRLSALSNVPDVGYDWGREYPWQDKLLAGPVAAGGSSSSSGADAAAGGSKKGPRPAAAEAPPVCYEWQWAALLFDTPIPVPPSALLIGSHLDADIHANACRIGFYGRAIEPLASSDIHELGRLKLFKRKEKAGVVERVEEGAGSTTGPVALIGKNLFKKETSVAAFTGLTLHTKAGQVGVLEAPFGKSGKFKAAFRDLAVADPAWVPAGAGTTAAATSTASSSCGKPKLVPLPSPPPIKAGDPLYLRYKKYLFQAAASKAAAGHRVLQQ